MLGLIKRIQNLENRCTLLYGFILIVIGLAMMSLHDNFGGSAFRDFIAGVLLGMSVAEMLAGVYITVRGLVNLKR